MSWPLAKLGDVISFVRGVTFTPEDQVDPFSDGSTVVMRTKNVQVAGLDQSDLIAVPSGFVRRKEQSLREGDILVSSANSWELVGKASYVPKLAYEATAGGFISIVRVKESLIDSRYLYHWVACPATQHKIRHCGRQTTNISNLDVGRFQNLEIPLPPLPEQKRIAAILDKADAIRRKRQQAIQLADDFLRAVFLDMFGDPVTNPKGWDTCKFEALTSLVTYGLTVRPQYHEEGIPLISAREIRTGELDYESCPKISRSDFDALSEKGRPKKDDILFSKTGSIGHCAIVKSELDFAVTQNAARIVPNKDICDPIFLLAFMRTNYFYDLANKEAKGNAVKDLQLGVMKDFPMYIPPVSLQKKFVDVYSKASLLSVKVSGGSVLLSSNFGALSQAAFSGQL